MKASKRETDYLLTHVRRENYQAIPLDVPDYTFENIPEPERHLFRTPTHLFPVVILRRRQ